MRRRRRSAFGSSPDGSACCSRPRRCATCRRLPSTVATPLGPAHGRRVHADVVLVPVLRAGLGMLPGMLELVPGARVGHIGLQRDERTAVASQYYAKLPPRLEDSYVLMIDPMLATGGSAVAALDMLSRAGARHIRLVCIVAAPEGIAAVEKAYPHVPIFTPAIDERLNDHKFIVPGLGDFGDRLYGTASWITLDGVPSSDLPDARLAQR